MINALVNFICGTVKICSETAHKDELCDFLCKSRIAFFDLEDGEKKLEFRIRKGFLGKLIRFTDEKGIPIEVSGCGGLPRYLKRYGRRYGIFIGIVIFILSVVISQRLVWNITVTGNEKTDEKEILTNLEKLGFTYGTDFNKVDFDKLHLDYLRKYDDLCWISVNMKGTWASVEVNDLDLPEDDSESRKMNVVASEKGRIIYTSAVKGKPMVRTGDHVAKGDLLISGIITVGEDGVRYESSEGQVFAEVTRTFEVNVPKIKREKRYTGEEKTDKSYVFFKKKLKLSRNSGISSSEYDTIEINERKYLFNTVPLPIFEESRVYRKFETVEKILSDEEISGEAKRLYSEQLSKCLDGAELVSVDMVCEENDEVYTENYSIVCIADIAEKKEIITD